MKQSPRAKTRKRSADGAGEPRQPLDRAKLQELALSYLNRFDCSSRKLEQHLIGRAKRLGAPPEVAEWISELVARYQSSGLLNDTRFATNLAAQLGARGKSSRAIAQKLAARGVGRDLSSDVLGARRQEQPSAELEAARTYVRKRKLGPFRAPEEREQFRQKDLASVARQGFSFDIARKALGAGASSDDEF